MNILNLFFDIISGERKINWLSIKFSRYQEKKRAKEATQFIDDNIKDYVFFYVSGAGHLAFSKNSHHICEQQVGFHFGVSWGNYPFMGGVLGRDEAKKMADFILENISKCDKSESEEYKQFKLRLSPQA